MVAYGKLPLNETEALSRESHQQYKYTTIRCTHIMRFAATHSLLMLGLNIVLVLVVLVLLLNAAFGKVHEGRRFVEEFSSYSPAVGAVRYITGTFNATQGTASPYVGTSNLTNEMWEYMYVLCIPRLSFCILVSFLIGHQNLQYWRPNDIAGGVEYSWETRDVNQGQKPENRQRGLSDRARGFPSITLSEPDPEEHLWRYFQGPRRFCRNGCW